MDSTTLRHLLSLSLVLAALMLPLMQGCASVDAFFDAPTLTAGERVCTAGTKAECDNLYAIAASLNTPEMNAAIAEALK